MPIASSVAGAVGDPKRVLAVPIAASTLAGMGRVAEDVVWAKLLNAGRAPCLRALVRVKVHPSPAGLGLPDPAREHLMTAAKPIGIVGFGLMGSALAQRLIGAGYGVVGFDIDAEKLRSLEKLGGTAAASPADAARLCDVLFLAVFNTEQVEEVVERDLLPALGAGSGKILLCASTCGPDRIAALAERIAPKGLHLLDTPISGTSEQVRQGRGVALVGGDEAKVADVAGILGAVFPSYFHMGPAGNAGRTKLAINLILGLNRLALAEGSVFAERMGARACALPRHCAPGPPTRR